MFMWTSDWRGWLRISCRRVLSWSPRNSSGPTREESGGRTSSWWSEDDARSPPPRPDTAISICITKWSRSCSEAPRAGQARPDACANVGPSKRPARCVRTTSGSGESRAGHHRPSSCRSAGRSDRSASRGSFGPQKALRTAGRPFREFCALTPEISNDYFVKISQRDRKFHRNFTEISRDPRRPHRTVRACVCMCVHVTPPPGITSHDQITAPISTSNRRMQHPSVAASVWEGP